MRTLKELWQIALDNYDINQDRGICCHLNLLCIYSKISIEEIGILTLSFYENKPTIFSRFWWNSSYLHPSDKFKKIEYWWKPNKEGNVQRKKFMEHLVNKYSK